MELLGPDTGRDASGYFIELDFSQVHLEVGFSRKVRRSYIQFQKISGCLGWTGKGEIP